MVSVEKAENLNGVVSFVSKAFGYEPGKVVAEDFPLIFNKENIGHLFVKKNDTGALLSHAGTFLTRLRVEGIEVSVGAIGGVATDKSVQGQGHATDLVKRCCDDLAQQGAALAFLWTGSHDFYRNLGFELVGRQWTLHLPYSQRSHLVGDLEWQSCPYNIEANREKVISDGLALLHKYPLGVVRSAKQHRELISIAGAKVFSASDTSTGELLAYLVVNKGLDLANHIHEWAGAGDALRFLTRKALEDSGVDLHLLTPQFTPNEVSWIYDIEKRGFKTEAGQMAMVKLLNFSSIQDLVAKRLEAMRLAPGTIEIKKQQSSYLLQWGSARANELTLSESDLLIVLFGPGLPSQQLNQDIPEIHLLDAVFPLRLWWWGLDSV